MEPALRYYIACFFCLLVTLFFLLVNFTKWNQIERYEKKISDSMRHFEERFESIQSQINLIQATLNKDNRDDQAFIESDFSGELPLTLDINVPVQGVPTSSDANPYGYGKSLNRFKNSLSEPAKIKLAADVDAEVLRIYDEMMSISGVSNEQGMILLEQMSDESVDKMRRSAEITILGKMLMQQNEVIIEEIEE
jgi:hypothetical protein